MANLKRMMFTDEESQQKVSLADLLDSFADKQTEKQQKMFNDTLDSKLQPVLQKIDNVEKRVDAQDARIDTFVTKINELEASATASAEATASSNLAELRKEIESGKKEMKEMKSTIANKGKGYSLSNGKEVARATRGKPLSTK